MTMTNGTMIVPDSPSNPITTGSSTTTTSSCTKATKTMVVSWDPTIRIHEHPIILGDNPACSSGAPIQIGWKAQESISRNLDMYEYCRQDERKVGKKLVLPVQRRAQILLRAGYSLEKIGNAVMEVEMIQKQRRETLSKQGWDRVAQVLESTGRIPKGLMKGVLGTTGDILTTTGGLVLQTGGLVASGVVQTGGLVASGVVQTGGLVASAGGMIVSTTGDLLMFPARRISKNFSSAGSQTPKTLVGRSA